jgi:hypothetical protein
MSNAVIKIVTTYMFPFIHEDKIRVLRLKFSRVRSIFVAPKSTMTVQKVNLQSPRIHSCAKKYVLEVYAINHGDDTVQMKILGCQLRDLPGDWGCGT